MNPTPADERREAIARIIHPKAFNGLERNAPNAAPRKARERAEALAKADAILASEPAREDATPFKEALGILVRLHVMERLGVLSSPQVQWTAAWDEAEELMRTEP